MSLLESKPDLPSTALSRGEILTPSAPLQSASSNIAQLSRAQKAAIILVMLGPKYAPPIFQSLTKSQIANLIQVLEKTPRVTRGQCMAVIEEFILILDGQKGDLRAGPKRAKDLVKRLVSDEVWEKFSDGGTDRTGPANAQTWVALNEMPMDQLIAFLQYESINTQSLILSQLNSVKVGEILAEMDEIQSKKIAKCLAEEHDYSAMTIMTVETYLQDHLLTQKSDDKSDQMARFMADALSAMPKIRRETILEDISRDAAQKAQLIRKHMLAFEDLPDRLPPTAIQIVLKALKPEELLQTLKAGLTLEPGATEFIFKNISQRLAEQYRDEIDRLPEQSDKEANKAASKFIATVLSLSRKGQITLIKLPEPEE